MSRASTLLAFALCVGCQHGGEQSADHAVATSQQWLRAPMVDASIAVPKEAHRVVAHAFASGSQNYKCTATPDNSGHGAWTFTGPEATLSGSSGGPMGRHFASSGGATAPEWQTPDGTYVVGKKVAAFTPSGVADAVPWLLLQVDSHGGTGPLADARYIQRVNTKGGVAPKAPCDNIGAEQKVPYSADYFFFAP
jgi:hypothetical protein